MIRNFSEILGALGFALAIAVCLLAAVGTSKAQEFSAEQRSACTGDAFRFCSSEMPNIPAITACMRKNHSGLSAGCKAVFPR